MKGGVVKRFNYKYRVAIILWKIRNCKCMGVMMIDEMRWDLQEQMGILLVGVKT